ncbi:sce7725 family protein [Cobetia amphilecti]|uniref:sce7725 family protein n=1 Tax=Cobetia amphilecti TaxID=1055104 RepID=UPI0009FDC947|nr:sce7725 family protein [Cobetia amphilecti]
MYYPYFRGKQFELIAIRESAQLLADAGFIPVIEPVKEVLRGLERTLDAICDVGGKAVVIINPGFGDHTHNGESIEALLDERYSDYDGISVGILLKGDATVVFALAAYNKYADSNPYFIHAGFNKPKELAECLGVRISETRHIFIEKESKQLYRKHFKDAYRVLISDGFKRVKNADYPDIEVFSELHITYEDFGMDGFGDFLTVGDDYTEGGGPAYAVAIHITFIDNVDDDIMYIYHFKSTTNDTPTNPAGKFGQALSALIEKLESGDSGIFESLAIEELRSLHSQHHFPGLGLVKKISMKHHLETMVNYFEG